MNWGDWFALACGLVVVGGLVRLAYLAGRIYGEAPSEEIARRVGPGAPDVGVLPGHRGRGVKP